MKTISLSGKAVKSKPVTLSKAARYLSKFLESDSGVSEANLGFLKRISAAFNEHNAFHKEIKKDISRRLVVEGEVDAEEKVKSGGELVVDGGKKGHTKKEKKNKKNGVIDVEFDGRKRKKLGDGEDERNEDSAERKSTKRRKKNRE